MIVQVGRAAETGRCGDDGAEAPGIERFGPDHALRADGFGTGGGGQAVAKQ